MDWNPSQKEAIETRGKNILVSAAAGSGKTAVLVERIKRLMIDDRVPVDRFLVVTFTEAAASEMKAKLEKALKEEILDAEGEDLRYIKEQLEMLPDADISTFHSFALEIIRKYFYRIGLEPDLAVTDETDAGILKQKAADNVFDREYEAGTAGFIDFVMTYGTDRKDDDAKQLVMDMYEKIMSISDPFGWLSEHTETLACTEEEFRKTPLMDELMEDTRDGIRALLMGERMIGGLLNNAGAVKLGSLFCERADKYERMDIDRLTYEQAGRFMDEFSNIRMQASKDEKQAFDTVKDAAQEIRKKARARYDEVKARYYTMSLGEYIADMNAVYPRAGILEGLVIKFRDEYARLKRERGVIDFNDIEHYALDILAAEPQVSEEYRKRFEHILIDEYQDTNGVQEALISSISRKDNLFMVGDVKQSIYSFRLAEPEIFLDKYVEYAHDDDSVRIELNENYRSKQGVIDPVNDVFLGRMVGYDENSRLNRGISYDGPLAYGTELVLIDMNIDEADEIDEEIASMKKAELEAKVAADLIREAMELTVYDTKAERERPVSYRDIVILCRSLSSKSGIYERTLNEEGIPVYVDDDEGYFDTLEISIIENVLRIIDNPRQDIPLISVLYSPIFGFSGNDLIDIRRNHRKEAYHKAFDAYCEEGPDEVLKEKCLNVRKTMDKWRHLALNMDISDLLWEIMTDTGYYTYAGALAGGVRRQANLRALCRKAEDMASLGICDLRGFLDRIDSIRAKKDIRIGQMKTSSAADDVVRIMTVHKSKGLEFPVVIAPSQGDGFNFRKRNNVLSFNNKLGYGLTRIERKKHWKRTTLVENIIDYANKRREQEEEKRILYVQYTRAADKLYLLGSAKKYVIRGFERMFDDLGTTPLEYIKPAVGSSITLRIKDLKEMTEEKKRRTLRRDEVRYMLDHAVCTDESIREKLSYVYPYEGTSDVRSKISVTDIYSEGEKVRELKTPGFIRQDDFGARDTGTFTHRLLEYIPYDTGDVRAELEKLVERRIFTEEEAAAVNIPGVEAFLRSDIGKRAAASSELRREQPFSMTGEVKGSKVLIQGIIDCCFLEGEEYVIIDFKYTGRRNDDDIKRTYKGQIDLYHEAVEKSLGRNVKERYIFLLKEGRALEI